MPKGIYIRKKKEMSKNKTKILLYDIENTPTVVTTWSLFEANAIETLEEWYILSYSYKWLGEKTTHVVSLPDFKGYKNNKKDDYELCKSLHKLFEEADVVIAHNGDSHDQKKSNSRFIYHGMTPPSQYKTIDTKKVAKKYFKFNSNSLDNLGSFFKIGNKVKNEGIALWRGCMNGDEDSWRRMCKYNKQDVVLLEKLYNKLKPWMTNHPNVNILNGKQLACPICGGDHLQKRGFNITKTGKVQRYQCSDCGGWSNGKSIKVVEIK